MNYDEKAIVKIESDGSVAKCAKGLSGNECGFKAGSKICGKCGAMAVQIKMVPVDEMDEEERHDGRRRCHDRAAENDDASSQGYGHARRPHGR